MTGKCTWHKHMGTRQKGVIGFEYFGVGSAKQQ